MSREVSPNDLKAGDVLARDVRDEKGRKVLSGGHRLTEATLNALRQLEIRTVVIDDTTGPLPVVAAAVVGTGDDPAKNDGGPPAPDGGEDFIVERNIARLDHMFRDVIEEEHMRIVYDAARALLSRPRK